MRTISLASLFVTTLFAACTAEQPTTPGTDELAGENGQDGEAAKADGVDNFGFMSVTPTTCSGPVIWCSQYTLARVNRTTTPCFGGSTAANCPVHDIDWAAMNLSQTTIDSLTKAIGKASDSNVQVLVRGSFKSFVEFTSFEPTEVWLAQRDGGKSTGTFVRIFDRGIKCITAPCPQFSEGRLNSTRAMNIDGFDFNGVSDALEGDIYDATSKGSGVIVVGDRTTRSAVSFVEELRTVNQAFLPVTK